MGRCQSTPGLVETKGQVTIEDMWISPGAFQSATTATTFAMQGPLFIQPNIPR